jgi:hypothetical protein
MANFFFRSICVAGIAEQCHNFTSTLYLIASRSLYMQPPPAAPNHEGLTVSPTLTELTSILTDKVRPRWVDGIKVKIWEKMQTRGLAMDVLGVKYSRCYMCMSPRRLEEMEIDHIRDWSTILAALRESAKTESGRSQTGYRENFFRGKKGVFEPTLYAGVYFSNDLDNLILICGGSCNQSKSNVTPEVAFQRNMYSVYGNLTHTFTELGYGTLLTDAGASDNPMEKFLGGINKSMPLKQAFAYMNEEFEEQMKSQMRLMSKMSGLIHAWTPVEKSEVWADTTRKPGGDVATPNQQTAMTFANIVSNPKTRMRASLTDDFVGTRFDQDERLKTINRESLGEMKSKKRLAPPGGRPIDSDVAIKKARKDPSQPVVVNTSFAPILDISK